MCVIKRLASAGSSRKTFGIRRFSMIKTLVGTMAVALPMRTACPARQLDSALLQIHDAIAAVALAEDDLIDLERDDSLREAG